MEEVIETDEESTDLENQGTDDDSSNEEGTQQIEEIATELGWNGDFKGEKFVDAKEYILKGREIQNTMRDHIKDQKGQLDGLVSSVKELKIHNERVYKAEVTELKSQLTDLKAEKKEAIEEGDVDRVEALDDQIDEKKEAIKQPAATSNENPEFDSWVKDNDWYNSDPEMAKFADAIADNNVGAPFGRLSKLVTKKVKDMFPEKFNEGNSKENTKTPSPVEGATRKSNPDSKFTRANLTSGQKAIMNQFVKQGIMTEKQYIKDISVVEGAA